MKIVKRTDIGRRACNEDACLVTQWAKLTLLAVSDGMGGHAAGRRASELTVGALRECFCTGGSEQPDFLPKAFATCNRAVWQAARENPTLRGMGATLVTALLWPDHFEAANVGDSRLYHFSRGQLKQVSRDHSFVGELVRLGILTPEAAARHPKRNVIMRAIGTDEFVDCDTFSGAWAEGDLLLLCSDGLYDFVTDEEIAACCACGRPLEDRADALIERALAREARDNISVVLAFHDGGAL
ncbi:MAG: protein phosphatase 2C domain-containing protein [Clostridiales bacterium]|nr:protein phosphatase 2C domain-containing protein [Clostridiales bacterium]